MKKQLKRILSIVLAAVFAFALLPVYAFAAQADTENWALFVYMCGTDLESNYGAATNDLLEMLKADIPDNVQVFVYTGGTNEWDPLGKGKAYGDGYIKPDSEKNQIFEIKDHKMTEWGSTGSLSMGDPASAIDFFDSVYNYVIDSVDHVMLEFWDHGGAITGVAFDEVNDHDNLSLAEIREILEAAKETVGKKLDIVGFDACLMSTLEVAAVLAPYADYLLASEEAEPDTGWDYGFLSEIKANSTAKDFGKAIVDNYTEWDNSAMNFMHTLALTDLSKIGGVIDAFNEFFDVVCDVLYAEAAETGSLDTYVKLVRIADTTQSMYAPYNFMIDLYHFMYEAGKINDKFKAAADKVIKALGSPYGSDKTGYDGHITPDYYLGATLGDGAVVYRGTGFNYNRGIGLTFYYPVTGTALSVMKVADIYDKAGLLELFGFSGTSVSGYCEYLENIGGAGSEDLREFFEFKGELELDVEEETSGLILSVSPKTELNKLKKVELITVLKLTENGETYTILLGSEAVNNGWENNKFTYYLSEHWYSMGGKPITFIMDGLQDRRELDGTIVMSGTVPAFIAVDDGKACIMANLSVSCIVAAEDGSPKKDLVGKMVVNACNVIATSDEELAPASRGYNPEDFKYIYPTIATYDEDFQSIAGYGMYDEFETKCEFEIIDGECYLPVTVEKLIGSKDKTYSAYYKVTDMNNDFKISGKVDYDIIDDFNEFEIEVILPQAFTGEAVKPKVHVLYKGEEILEEGKDYIVSYLDNTVIGTATVVVTSLIDDLPGIISREFIICEYEDLAEETMKLLPKDHDPSDPDACEDYDEYKQNVKIIEQIQRYLAYGIKLSDANHSFLSGLSIYPPDTNLRYKDIIDVLGAYTAYNAFDFKNPFIFNLVVSELKASDFKGTTIEGAKLGASYDIKLFGVDAELENFDLRDLKEDETVTIKIKLDKNINTDNLVVVVHPDNGAKDFVVYDAVVELNGEKYVVFDTNVFGQVGIFEKSTEKAPETGVALAVVPLIAIAAAGIMISKKRR